MSKSRRGYPLDEPEQLLRVAHLGSDRLRTAFFRSLHAPETSFGRIGDLLCRNAIMVYNINPDDLLNLRRRSQ